MNRNCESLCTHSTLLSRKSSNGVARRTPHWSLVSLVSTAMSNAQVLRGTEEEGGGNPVAEWKSSGKGQVRGISHHGTLSLLFSPGCVIRSGSRGLRAQGRKLLPSVSYSHVYPVSRTQALFLWPANTRSHLVTLTLPWALPVANIKRTPGEAPWSWLVVGVKGHIWREMPRAQTNKETGTRLRGN